LLGWLVRRIGRRDLDASIVERHVQPAERGNCAVDHGGDLVFGGDVTGYAEGLVARGGQVISNGAEGACVDVGQDDGGARLGESLRGGQPHA